MKKVLKILLAILVVAALLMLGMKAVNNKKQREASKPVAKTYSIIVKSIKPEFKDVKLTLPYLAESINETDVTLSARIASRVEVLSKSGATVNKGDVVAKLDTTELKANISALKITLNNQLQSYKRTKALYRVKGASIEQLQKEQSALANLKAKLKTLENQVSYATIIAPISGVVSKTFVAVGDITMPGKPLVKISAQNNFSLLVRTPKTLTPTALLYDGREYKLQDLKQTFNGLKEYKAYLEDVKNINAGERVAVDVIVYDAKGTLLPFDTILNREGKSYVLVVDGNRVKAKEVHLLISAQEGVLVEDKLDGNEIVLAKQDILLKLLSGSSLSIKE